MEKYCHLFYYDTQTKETVFVYREKEIGRKKDKPVVFIKCWCLENGSTMEGRLKSCRHLLKIVQKPPILISERQRLVFMTTTSHTTEDCVFIQSRGIQSIKKTKENATRIVMQDGSAYIILLDYRIINRQYKRSLQLLEKLKLTEQKFLLFEI
ncbi:MAG: competence protein ComK [Anaerorhabdus sp.]